MPRAVYDRLSAESGQVMFEAFFWMFDDRRAVHVDFAEVKCPVLVISGTEDRAVPPITGRKIAEQCGTHATYHEVPGHAHFGLLEPGWQAIAEYCVDWMAEAVKLSH
jgi:non-heme chloroperoxidase